MQNNPKGNTFISALLSIALHGMLGVLLFLSYSTAAKPKQLAAMKVSLIQPEPPKPAPPKPEPPKPTPPKPEPPKPEPPKVVKPLPTPKPVPKQEQPKPKPEPAKTQAKPKPMSIEERLKAAETVKPKTQPKPNRGADIAERLSKAMSNTQPSVTPSNAPVGPVASAGIIQETTSYADNIARPYIMSTWVQPVKGELDIANPTPVEITFTVYASGSIANARITKRSNSNVLNRSVENYLKTLTRMEPISKIGSKATSLQIGVTMILTN